MSKEFDISSQSVKLFYNLKEVDRMATARERRLRTVHGVHLVGNLVLVGVILAGFTDGLLPVSLPKTVAAALATALLIGTWLVSLAHWRFLDHMEQDSALYSWFWGGNLSGSLAVLAMIIFGAKVQLIAGAAVIITAQIAGFAVALTWWSLRYHSKNS